MVTTDRMPYETAFVVCDLGLIENTQFVRLTKHIAMNQTEIKPTTFQNIHRDGQHGMTLNAERFQAGDETIM